jgi:hypothetical protein
MITTRSPWGCIRLKEKVSSSHDPWDSRTAGHCRQYHRFRDLTSIDIGLSGERAEEISRSMIRFLQKAIPKQSRSLPVITQEIVFDRLLIEELVG